MSTILSWVLLVIYSDFVMFFALQVLALLTLIPGVSTITGSLYRFAYTKRWPVYLILSLFPWLWALALLERRVKILRASHPSLYIIIASGIGIIAGCVAVFTSFFFLSNITIFRVCVILVLLSAVLISYAAPPEPDSGDDDNDEPETEPDDPFPTGSAADRYIQTLSRNFGSLVH